MKKLKMLKNLVLAIGFLIANSYLASANPQENSDRSIFSEVYRSNLWIEGSGIGSNPNYSMPYIKFLQQYFNDDRINKIVDLGCGDWRIMAKVNIPDSKKYIGYDVVEEIIAANNEKFAKRNIQFVAIKLLKEMEDVKADLLIVKDVLAHWPNSQVQYFLKKILPNYKYALITHDIGHVFDSTKNYDIKLGEYRAIDITAEPFNLKSATIAFQYECLGYHKVTFLYTNFKR